MKCTLRIVKLQNVWSRLSVADDVPLPVRLGELQPAASARFSSCRKNKGEGGKLSVQDYRCVVSLSHRPCNTLWFICFYQSKHVGTRVLPPLQVQVSDPWLSYRHRADVFGIKLSQTIGTQRCHLQQLPFRQEAFHPTQRLALCHVPGKWASERRDLSEGYRLCCSVLIRFSNNQAHIQIIC